MLEDLKSILDYVGKQFGAIHKSAPCNYNGEKGFLVWDYVLFNEITFVNEKTKEYQSLFTSWSDSKTEEEFNRLLELSKKSTRSDHNPIQRIKELKELLDMGAISEKEFEKKKKELLEEV
ncbi:hypothetical protein EJF36_19125 [Bacillus sp. HMF5848]|uniref:SHOCT domain-containing protein n=1 Tax=Bacillus sp. HMF5848 TaxID=2495421 RepID=UPI000F7955A9|nr:SHOCT domain-containing protein [Bacillus sp. HMF5848]RSK28817.1 hypothetical protein EJF36_19125 [Bacillus sp. HMF5848]